MSSPTLSAQLQTKPMCSEPRNPTSLRSYLENTHLDSNNSNSSISSNSSSSMSCQSESKVIDFNSLAHIKYESTHTVAEGTGMVACLTKNMWGQPNCNGLELYGGDVVKAEKMNDEQTTGDGNESEQEDSEDEEDNGSSPRAADNSADSKMQTNALYMNPALYNWSNGDGSGVNGEAAGLHGFVYPGGLGHEFSSYGIKHEEGGKLHESSSSLCGQYYAGLEANGGGHISGNGVDLAGNRDG
jgi:hypothetical protein